MPDQISVNYLINSDQEFPWILRGMKYIIDEDNEQQTLRLLLGNDINHYMKESHLWLLWDALQSAARDVDKSLSARFDTEYELVECEVIITLPLGAEFIYNGEVINKKTNSYPEDFIPMVQHDVVTIETCIDAEQQVRTNVDYALIGLEESYRIPDPDDELVGCI